MENLFYFILKSDFVTWAEPYQMDSQLSREKKKFSFST